ncbi:hypothetical protein BGZ83_012096 [Gryganskiella cystojenkinii]|nr:hypothetical protein BGZ83_012096 [Gryganskiella cystojenkinii]
MSTPTSTGPTSPKIMIAGGGIGGLFMGLLLEKAGIDYEIFESSKEFLPLGAACGLSYNIMAAIDQLGLLEEVKKISTTVEINTIFKQDMEVIREIRLRENKQGTGYDTLVTSRPEFHSLLLTHIPKDKIHMGKKIVALQQDSENVTITCEDKSTYTADILIGADGHYSDVRKALYKDMEKDDLSPKIKTDDPQVHILSYLGVAEDLDPANYEGLGEEESHSDTIIGEGRGETWRYFTCTDNRVAWRFDYQSSTMTTEDIEAWKNSDYLTFPKEEINPEIRKFELAIMGNLGQMFDATPKERLSKVVLEENVPQSWYHKRTVLIGDAAHRTLPNFGALNAILDTIILSNALYEIPSVNQKNITRAFEEFYVERFPSDERDLSPKQQSATIMAGKTWLDTAGRFVMMKMVPKYFKERSLEYICQYRPQILFLPRVESKGTVQSTPQRPSKKYAALLKTQASAAPVATAV